MDYNMIPRSASDLRKHVPFFLVCACALVILFGHLGLSPLWGSEGRWAVIGRYMFQNGDIFHPMLGIAPYWDKPLVSYWQILPVAHIMGGVNELTARMPSAVWALVLLFLAYDLAKRWFGRESALMTSAVLCTTYGFVLWGRNAQVEMTNAAMIMLFFWYFFTRKTYHNHTSVYALAILMGVGANMKGLVSVGVPVFCILLLSLVKKDWEWLPPLKVLSTAAVVLVIAFLCIPLAQCLHSSSLEPLHMIWKENVVRFFEPFDHKAPFYTYFYRIFDLAAPWSILIPPALFYYLKRERYKEAGVSDALLTFASIFLFFTISGSRRPYYLLPILPFAAMLVGDFLSRFIQSRLPSAIELTTKLIGVLISICLLVPIACFIIKPHELPYGIQSFFPWTIVLLAGGLVMALSFLKRSALGMIAPVALFWFIFVFTYIPWSVDQQRNVRSETAKVTTFNRPVGFLKTDDAKIIFYLNKPYSVLSDLRQARTWADHTGGILIAYDDIQDPYWKRIINEKEWKAYISGYGAHIIQ